MKRILTVLSLLMLISICFVSCTDNAPNDTQGTQTSELATAPSERLIVNSEGTKYKLVVQAGNKTLYSAATELKSEMFSISGKQVFVMYSDSDETNECEILIGNTGRSDVSLAEGLSKKQFRVTWQKEKLVIVGGCSYATNAGIDWLYEKHIKGDEGAVYIPSDLDYMGSVDLNLDFKGLSNGWNSLIYPTEDGTTLKYQIYMPKSYDESKDYPCILYMHSAGVRCDDNSHIYKAEAKFLRNFEQSKYANEAIIIAPCCPKTEKWIPAATWSAVTYDYVNTEPTKYMKAVTELFYDAKSQLSIPRTTLMYKA